MLSRFFVLFPLVLSLAAFILSFLCLFAGRDEGFMEEYDIARLNMSMLGHNLIDTDGDASAQQDSGGDSLLDTLGDKWDEVKDDVKEGVNNITGSIADELADTLGISEFYSIHVMQTCEGMYKPNATNPGAGYNVTNCTESAPDKRFNLTEMVDQELGIGPLSLSLADINWPSEIQDAIDMLNKALLAQFILYVLGVGFSGLAMLACAAAFFLYTRRGVNAVNLILAALAALVLTVSSILVTVAGKKGVDKINEVGDDVGVSASAGNKFLGLTWAAAGVMIVATIYWTMHLCMMRKERRREWKPRKGSY
ncbi:hypothetical protein FZEAL_6978 [Fusarium zealandicum]|uniref:Sur7 protein n=1 Tax=Fusarium zealandicum TaxID=1053134 RepID=A0A8H4UHE3_9HYPO|nr:hypothetical protein FZEAL_6978 [Fusarium zealandicum]